MNAAQALVMSRSFTIPPHPSDPQSPEEKYSIDFDGKNFIFNNHQDDPVATAPTPDDPKLIGGVLSAALKHAAVTSHNPRALTVRLTHQAKLVRRDYIEQRKTECWLEYRREGNTSYQILPDWAHKWVSNLDCTNYLRTQILHEILTQSHQHPTVPGGTPNQ